MKKILVIFLLSFAVSACQFNEIDYKKGIITIPNYQHGVVICGEVMMVNKGHEQAMEVKQLRAAAIVHCPKGSMDRTPFLVQ